MASKPKNSKYALEFIHRLDGLAIKKQKEEIERLKAEVERLTKAVMHSPAAQLKLKELEGKTTFDEINPKNSNGF
jgi:hypothetical protein